MSKLPPNLLIYGQAMACRQERDRRKVSRQAAGMLAIKLRLPVKGDRMRRLLAFLPLILGLSGCIDSSVDLSASLPSAFPIKEGFTGRRTIPVRPLSKC